MASRGTHAVAALESAGRPFELHSYDYTGEKGAIGLEAAMALGVDPGRVFKTLVGDVDGVGLVMAIIPVAATLDLKALAHQVGGKRAAMADIRKAERATGYIKGGISPFGQKQKLAAILDDSALAHETIFVSGGKRGLEIEISASDLLAVLGAETADIARE
ncbi:MAG: Cys-tRNA(Pro) deacylase [Geminicoccaceae bacterium]|nr:Cys-tRNA(Pro) deacylase [Geminicoccaceae bacterium]